MKVSDGAAPRDCPYCRVMVRPDPQGVPDGYCGWCEVCGRPGHLGAHPRLPTSVVRCEAHWKALSRPGLRFDPSQLVLVLVALLALWQIWPALRRLVAAD